MDEQSMPAARTRRRGRPRSAAPRVQISVRLTPEGRQLLERLADRWGCSLGTAIERALRLAVTRPGDASGG